MISACGHARRRTWRAVLVASTVVTSAGAQGLPIGDLLQQGIDLVDQKLDAHGYEVDRAALASVPRLDDVVAFLSTLKDVLEGGSIEQLAWLRPEVESSLQWLEQWPAAEPYTSWLREQVDYVVVADEVVASVPEAPHRPKAADRQPVRPLAPPPPAPRVSPAVKEKIERASVSSEVWKQRLATRPRPRNAATLVPKLKPIFRDVGIPEQLVWLAEVESSFNPNARSPVGAAGLFQFMPATARRFGLSPERPDERLDPEKSARAAAGYLRILHRQFGSWPLALASYNAGEGRVARLLKSSQANSFEGIANRLPLETRLYVPKMTALLELREGVLLRELPAPR